MTIFNLLPAEANELKFKRHREGKFGDTGYRTNTVGGIWEVFLAQWGISRDSRMWTWWRLESSETAQEYFRTRKEAIESLQRYLMGRALHPKYGWVYDPEMAAIQRESGSKPGANLTRDQMIDAIVAQVEDWDLDTVVDYAQSRMRELLEGEDLESLTRQYLEATSEDA